MIKVALSWEDSELKTALVFNIANHMKKCYLNWNKDTVEDAVIFKHLKDLSNGVFDLTDSGETLSDSSNLLKKSSNGRNSNNSNKNKKNKNRKHQNRYK